MGADFYSDARQIIQTLARDASLPILWAIQKEPEKAYLNNLEVQLKKYASRATIHACLKEMDKIGIITAMPYLEPSEKRLVLRYKISKKGSDILKTIEHLSLADETHPRRLVTAG